MQFYVMELVYNRNEFTIAGGIWINPPSYDNKCPVCGKPVLEWPDEIEIELERIGRAGFVEVLSVGAAPVDIFCQDVIDLWQSAGFTGFTTRPVRIGWRKGKREKRPFPSEIPQYRQLVTTSKVALKQPPLVYHCPACGYKEYDSYEKTGLHVDISTWDRSSIFGTDGTGSVLCVREVAEVTLQAGLGKSIPFVHAEKWDTWEDYNVRNWGDDLDRYRKMRERYIIRRVEDL